MKGNPKAVVRNAAIIEPLEARQLLTSIWAFEETAGATAYALPGYAPTALSLTGGATFAPGLNNNALALDGSSGYAEGAAAINTAQSFTVATWVKFNSTQGWQTLASQHGSIENKFWLSKRGDNGKFSFVMSKQDTAFSSQARVDSALVPDANRWYHVAGVYDASAKIMSLYVDGGLEGTVDYQPVWDAPGPITFGAAYAWGGGSGHADFVNGQLDQALVESQAWGPDILGAFARRSASWNFDDFSNPIPGVAKDSSRSNNNLQLLGGAQMAAGGYYGNALSLNGTTAYGQSDGPGVAETSRGFSIGMWVNLSSTNGWQTLMSQAGYNENKYWLSKRGDNGKFSLVFSNDDVAFSSQTRVDSTLVAQPNRWYHLAGVFDSINHQIRLYVDGALQGQQAYYMPWNATQATVVGAARPWGGGTGRTDFVSGKIDTAFVKSESLSTNQVRRLAGLGDLPVAVPSDVRVASFDDAHTTADVTWADHADNELGFHVQKSTDGGTTWTTAATTGPNQTHAVVEGLDPNQTVQLRVVAYDTLITTAPTTAAALHPGPLDAAVPDGYVLVDTLNIDATQTNARENDPDPAKRQVSHFNLAAGVQYFAKVTGTAPIAVHEGRVGDAEFQQIPNDPRWLDQFGPDWQNTDTGVRLAHTAWAGKWNVKNAVTYGRNTTGAYTQPITGDGSKLSAFYNDVPGWYGDNAPGGMKVEVYAPSIELTTTPTSGTTLDLSWTAPAGSDHYDIMISEDGETFHDSATLDASSSDAQVDQLLPGERFVFKVLSFSATYQLLGASPKVAQSMPGTPATLAPGTPSTTQSTSQNKLLVGINGAREPFTDTLSALGNVWFERIIRDAGGSIRNPTGPDNQITYDDDDFDGPTRDLLEKIDVDHDKHITAIEAGANKVVIMGYSWGAITAGNLTRKLRKGTVGFGLFGLDDRYTLDVPINVDKYIAIDPVHNGPARLIRFLSGPLETNIKSFSNYYQQRGGVADFNIFKAGSSGNGANFNINDYVRSVGPIGSWFSALIKGTELDAHKLPAGVVKQKNIQDETLRFASNVEWQEMPIALTGISLATPLYDAELAAQVVQHDMMPWYVRGGVGPAFNPNFNVLQEVANV